jgi:hypothetical protein
LCVLNKVRENKENGKAKKKKNENIGIDWVIFQNWHYDDMIWAHIEKKKLVSTHCIIKKHSFTLHISLLEPRNTFMSKLAGFLFRQPLLLNFISLDNM